ncbi:MAG: carboxypeptidase-like regulatory domain-containing protein [Spirochaetia bacterium]|nr:carboxypeptidase-like regulatory domain-containing protein [Spirochaetia bacterium]
MLRSDLSGRVFMNNNPVGAGVKIKAISKHTDKVYVTKTDEDGRFRFEKLKIGAYVISIEATYIVEKAVAVTVNRGKNPEMKIDVKRR